MATGNVTVTTAANFIPEIWSTEILEAYVANLVFGALVNRRHEAEVATKGDTIHVPNLDAMTVGQKTAGNAVTFSANTENVTDIVIDQDWYVAFRIDNIAEVQSMNDQRGMYTRRAGVDLAVKIDSTVAALVDAFSQNVGTLTADITDDNLIRSAQYLNDANAPVNDRSLVLSPGGYTSVQKLDKFQRLDYHNIAGATMVEQVMLNTPIYGARVYVTTNVEGDNTNGHDSGMFQKDVIALVMQQEPKVFTQFMIEYISDAVVVEAIWGLKEMRDTSGVWIKGK